jgi:hypothetical protein
MIVHPCSEPFREEHSMDGYDGADHCSIASSKAARFLLNALDVKRVSADTRLCSNRE